MSTTIISKSNKNRFPATYNRIEGKILHRDVAPKKWQQEVTKIKVADPKTGKITYRSETRHVPR